MFDQLAGEKLYVPKEEFMTVIAQLESKLKEGDAIGAPVMPDKSEAVIHINDASTRDSLPRVERHYEEDLPSGATRAVSLHFLKRFCNAHNAWNMPVWQVVRDVIVPATSSKMCRYTDFLPEECTEMEDGDIGPPNAFISHAWGNSLGLITTSLLRYAGLFRIPQTMLL
jgi:hypothetical protein